MQQAFDFHLPDQDGRFHRLSEYQGKWVILFFYPRDNTPTCTTEVCSFENNYEAFKNQNVTLLGISGDSTESHQGFSTKYTLNFPILSDESKETINAYGAWGKKVVYGKEVIGILRKTYLINPEGNIVKAYEKVDPSDDKHVQEILADLHTFSK